MSTNIGPQVGKISSQIFSTVIFPALGAQRAEVLVRPQHGVDIGIVDLGHGQVMAVTTDPFFIVPEYGWQRAAWFAVHIVASDAATSGLRPAYITVDLNLPPSMTGEDLSSMWCAVHETCSELGVAIVAGHTGRYDNCEFPMVGGATMFSIGCRDEYVTPAMAGVGDAVLLTKGPAIETTALFGVTFPDRIVASLGTETAHAAAELFGQMSVVKDALTAVQVGVRDRGVTAMHDATERGVLGGLVEIAEASNVGLVVDLDAITVRPEVRAVCDHFGVDPYVSSSEGTLLITCRPRHADAIRVRLAEAGIDTFCVGEILPPAKGLRVVQDGREQELHPPQVDPFWPAYRHALEARLR
ncbi:MAG: AIR synthase family protein [Chloroflexota bacterium]